MAEWVVRARRAREPWVRRLMVLDVPDEVQAAEILAALELWPQWSKYRPMMIEQGDIVLRALDSSSDLNEVPGVNWVQIEPRDMRLTVPIPATDYMRYRTAATLAHMPLTAWVRNALALYEGSGT